ncbi:MAG TPA: serine/threonine-protein kinase [Chloroflexota bacterium]
MNLPPGHTLGGFCIIEKIGRGAMGTVYRARQLALERDVALKVLDSSEDEAAFKRFRDEAVHVAQLKHPNILPVFDFGRQDDVTYIAMELADGGTLAARIGQPIPAAEAIELLRPVAEAIDYAHAANIIHRDVKPGNLLFDNGRLFLSDFGLALMHDTKSSSWAQMVGTPWYMAPEQFRGNAVPASDIYALAVTLFQMLTGRVPFDRESALAVALAHLRDPIPSAKAFHPGVPDPVDRVLARGLAKEPSARYPRAIDLLSAVAEALRQPGWTSTGGSAPGEARPAAKPTPVLGRAAPAPGRQIFESKPTVEWARASIILRDSKNRRLLVRDDGLIQLMLTPPNQGQVLLPVGVLEEVWAELRFGVAPASGTFDLLWNEGTSALSYCARVDVRQGQLALGLLPAASGSGEQWLASRAVTLAPEGEHTLLVVAAHGSMTAYLDGKEALAASDSTLTQGLVRVRMLPAPGASPSTFLLRRIAIFRPPEK